MKFSHFLSSFIVIHSPTGRFPEPAFDQRSGNATALGDSKTGTRNFWFRFDSARASEIVVEASFQSSPEVPQRSRLLAQTRRIAASGDQIKEWLNELLGVLLPTISIVFKTNQNRSCNGTFGSRSFRQAYAERNEDSRYENGENTANISVGDCAVRTGIFKVSNIKTLFTLLEI